MPKATIYAVSFSKTAIDAGCRTARLSYTANKQRKSASFRSDRITLVSSDDVELLTAVRNARLDWSNKTSPYKFIVELAEEAEQRKQAEVEQKERLAEADRSPHVVGSLAASASAPSNRAPRAKAGSAPSARKAPAAKSKKSKSAPAAPAHQSSAEG